MTAERMLTLLLRLVGGTMLLAFVAAALPLSTMAGIHSWLGLGELPSGAIVEYANRSLSLMYGLHGVVLLLLAQDVRRNAGLIRWVGVLHGVLAVTLLGIDLSAGMPWYWTALEGPTILPAALAMVWLARRVESRAGPRGSVAGATLAVLCAAVAPSISFGQEGSRSATSTPAEDELTLDHWFRFQSSPWLNLHHVLMQETESPAGPIRRPPRPTQLHRERWAPEEGEMLEAALDYYREHLAARDLLFDAGMVKLRDQLAGRGADDVPESSADLLEEHLAVLEDVLPAYLAHEWEDHERAAREAEARLRVAAAPMLDTLPARFAAAFDSAWPDRPIDVEWSVDAGWAGAYTTIDPPRIVVSCTDARHTGTLLVEILFHEAGHVLVGPVSRAIAAECERTGRAEPANFWHAVIFHTAGELVRDLVGEEHAPYAERFGLWNRPPMNAYRRVLDESWRPYLDGEGTMAGAVAAMLDALPSR